MRDPVVMKITVLLLKQKEVHSVTFQNVLALLRRLLADVNLRRTGRGLFQGSIS
jgi:hypothetical protein